MLQTNLEHITSEDEFREVLENNENVMICCGRMGPRSVRWSAARDWCQ